MGSPPPAFSVQGSIYIFLFRDIFLLRFVAANNDQSVHCTDTPLLPLFTWSWINGGSESVSYESFFFFCVIISLLPLPLLPPPPELVQVAATM